MKPGMGPESRMGVVRLVAKRFAFGSAVLMSFGLMLLGKADTVMVERARMVVTDTTAPAMDVLSYPVTAGTELAHTLSGLANLQAENIRLRRENENLLQWQTAARHLRAENQALRDLLAMEAPPASKDIGARIVADLGGTFARAVMVTAGSNAGIRKGQAVLSSRGLLGRVASVGPRSARVLLLTDYNARVPVMLEKSQSRAILAGDNTAQPQLLYTPEKTAVAIGDRVVTSGHAGAFPPGLPVGVISALDGGTPRVRLFANAAYATQVRIMDYDLRGILDPSQTPEPGSQQARSAP